MTAFGLVLLSMMGKSSYQKKKKKKKKKKNDFQKISKKAPLFI